MQLQLTTRPLLNSCRVHPAVRTALHCRRLLRDSSRVHLATRPLLNSCRVHLAVRTALHFRRLLRDSSRVHLVTRPLLNSCRVHPTNSQKYHRHMNQKMKNCYHQLRSKSLQPWHSKNRRETLQNQSDMNINSILLYYSYNIAYLHTGIIMSYYHNFAKHMYILPQG